MEGVSVLKENGCDFAIGLGGGSVLDSATVISAMSANDGTVWDYMQGGHGKGKKFKNKPLPHIEITTSAGTGSEVDCWGVVTNPEHKEKWEYKAAIRILRLLIRSLCSVSLPIIPHIRALTHYSTVWRDIFQNSATR